METMSNKKLTILFILVLFLNSFLIIEPNIGYDFNSALQIEKIENIDINVVFIGFDSEYTIEQGYDGILDSEVDTFALINYRFPNEKFPHSIYNVNYNFSSFSSLEETQFNAYIQSLASTTSLVDWEVNVTAVEEYSVTGEYDDPHDLYVPCEGKYIPVEQVDSYLFENHYQNVDPNSGYTLYLMNMSHLDDPETNSEHAYIYNLVDYDAVTLDTNHFTGDFDRATIGWGGDQRYCFVDISAISSNMLLYSMLFEANLSKVPSYTLYDLDNYASTLNLSSNDGKEDMLNYISQWINSYTKNVFLSQAIFVPPVKSTFDLPIAVISNITDKGYPHSSLSWGISSDRIYSFMKDGFPWFDWNIPIDYYELDDYPDISEYFSSNIQHEERGYFLDIVDVIAAIDDKRDTFFEKNEENTPLPTFIFLTDYVDFRLEDTTLGGIALGEYQILVRNPSQIFFGGDIDQPLTGLTHTLVHEIGHNLALDHPHNTEYGYGAMFIEDVMSYQYTSHGFSIFSQDTVGRFQFNYHYLIAKDNLTNVENQNLIGLNKANELVVSSYEKYLEMDYNSAIRLMKEALEIINDQDNPMRNPVILSVVIIGCTVTLSVGIVLTIKYKLIAKIKRLVTKRT
jgi:hypothetical protein